MRRHPLMHPFQENPVSWSVHAFKVLPSSLSGPVALLVLILLRVELTWFR